MHGGANQRHWSIWPKRLFHYLDAHDWDFQPKLELPWLSRKLCFSYRLPWVLLRGWKHLGRPLFHMDVKTHCSKSLSVFTSSSVLMSWNKVAVVSVGWSTGLIVNWLNKFHFFLSSKVCVVPSSTHHHISIVPWGFWQIDLQFLSFCAPLKVGSNSLSN